MGTTWRIYHSGDVLEPAARAVAALVHEDERRWSRFLADSELSRINCAAGRCVAVSPETLDLLEACSHWTTQADGVFQPLIGGPLEAWGYGSSLLEREAGVRCSPATEMPVRCRLDIDRRNGTVFVPEGHSIDLGGIAKSWSVVRAGRCAASLTEELSLLIDGGGDLFAVRGEHRVNVAPVDVDSAPLTIALSAGQGVATSASSKRRWRNGDGIEAHHLIDPDTGRPGATARATVIADDPVAADVLATVLSLRPEMVWTVEEACLVATSDRLLMNAAWELACRR